MKRQRHRHRHDCKSKLNRHNSFNDRLTCILLSCASQKHSSTLCGSNISTRQQHSKCTCFLRDNDDNQNASTVLCLHNSNSNRNSICYSDKSQGTWHTFVHEKNEKEIPKYQQKRKKFACLVFVCGNFIGIQAGVVWNIVSRGGCINWGKAKDPIF